MQTQNGDGLFTRGRFYSQVSSPTAVTARPSNVHSVLMASGTTGFQIFDGAAAVAATYATTVLADTPVLYYKLDEASGTVATDSSGNAHNGTEHGTITQGGTGLILGDAETADTFDGSTAYVACSTTGLVSNHCTIDAWILLASANLSGIIDEYGPNATNAFGIKLTSGGLVAVYNATSLAATGALPLNVPVHVAGVYDGTNLKSYVNGVLAKTLAVSSTALTMTSHQIGADLTGPANFLAATIGHAATYATALTAARLLAHYQAGAPGTLLGAWPAAKVGDTPYQIDCPTTTGIYVAPGAGSVATVVYT